MCPVIEHIMFGLLIALCLRFDKYSKKPIRYVYDNWKGINIALNKIDDFVKSPSGLSFWVKREIFILQPIEKIRFFPAVDLSAIARDAGT